MEHFVCTENVHYRYTRLYTCARHAHDLCNLNRCLANDGTKPIYLPLYMSKCVLTVSLTVIVPITVKEFSFW